MEKETRIQNGNVIRKSSDSGPDLKTGEPGCGIPDTVRENRIGRIGDLEPENPFFLAPMAGISDAPMRRICRQMGASLVYTEMISAKGLYYGDKKTDRLLWSYDEEKPTAIQIFGHEPDIIAYAAEKLNDRGHAILDINMGCPVPKIVKNGDGSALMKKPELVEQIIRAAVTASDRPVTAKIRAGYDENSRNAVEVALAVESGGASAVAVHGRTREQFYSGQADWSVIADVKKAVKIPVIGNGDVVDPASAIRLMTESGCDFVMVGRAVRGNPWIFRDLRYCWEGLKAPPRPGTDDKKEMMKRQFNELIALKGEYAAVREMRKIAGWYLHGVPGGARKRAVINTITDPQCMFEAINNVWSSVRGI